MTADKVGELEALLAKATPGPWAVNPFCAQVDAMPSCLPVCKLLWPTDERTEAETENNAALIAAAVNALPELLRIYRAWQGAAVGECSAAGRMELDGDSVCGFFISTSADELRRNPFGQRVRLVPDQAAA